MCERETEREIEKERERERARCVGASKGARSCVPATVVWRRCDLSAMTTLAKASEQMSEPAREGHMIIEVYAKPCQPSLAYINKSLSFLLRDRFPLGPQW